jgi:glycerol-3-phosphate dehydrogenase
MAKDWSSRNRGDALRKAEREGLDILVIGGGITGAGIFRDAAARGLNVLMVEKGDFASGTSSWSSKLIHGGLRYLAEGQLGVTRESCNERDLLIKNNPNMVRPLPSLFPAYKGSKEPRWKMRAALGIYSALANFRKSSRFKTLSSEEVLNYVPGLKPDKLQGAGLYYDGQADDARLVLESIKNGRELGGEALNYIEAKRFEHDNNGKISTVRIKDNIDNTIHILKPSVIINATGAAVERVRNMNATIKETEVKPAKGIHVVIPRDRIESDVFVTYKAEDGRHLFYIPWEDVSLLGTTDTFSDEIDTPTVQMKDVEYILSATNKAFPDARLDISDICSVYAGVRPLVTTSSDSVSSRHVSRDHNVWDDKSGMISVAGGKLTTFRAMGKEIVDLAIDHLPEKTKEKLKPADTRNMPLRNDNFNSEELKKTLREKFALAAKPATHLVRNYGIDALEIMEKATPELRETIGNSFFTYAEIPWVIEKEAVTSLPDILERRMRMAILSTDRGLTELGRIAKVAGDAAGWSERRISEEKDKYLSRIKQSYSIQP